MLDYFQSLGKLLRYRRVHIDGYVFRLHCTLTVIILLAFLIINSTKQLVGAPIACTFDRTVEDKDVINNWCYVRGIHSKTGPTNSGIYPGLGHIQDDDQYRRNVWYQWIWFMLLMQAISFYFPRWLWKGFEGGKMATFASNLDYFAIKDDKEAKKKTDIVVDYLYRTNGYNDWYAIKYFLCEVLALINVGFQMVINNIFLLDEYWSYGVQCVNYWLGHFTDDPMERVFPILSKCEMSRYGITSSKENLDFLCILSINVINQKIYLFCWFWFIFLAMALTLVIVFRLILICFPLMRYYCCRFRFELTENSRKYSRQLVVNRLSLGDWFILYLLGQNVEPIIFSEIIEDLCERLQIKNCPNDENVYQIQEVSKM